MSRGIDSQLIADRLSAEIRSQVGRKRVEVGIIFPLFHPTVLSWGLTYNNQFLNAQKDSLHSELLRDLAKVAASPAVKEEDFHSTFLKALGRSE